MEGGGYIIGNSGRTNKAYQEETVTREVKLKIERTRAESVYIFNLRTAKTGINGVSRLVCKHKYKEHHTYSRSFSGASWLEFHNDNFLHGLVQQGAHGMNQYTLQAPRQKMNQSMSLVYTCFEIGLRLV